MRDEHEKLKVDLEEIRSEEAEVRSNHASFEKDVAILVQERDRLRALALELKQLLNHWTPAKT